MRQVISAIILAAAYATQAGDSTSELETLQTRAWAMYSQIQDRLFQESTVFNRIIVTAERSSRSGDRTASQAYQDMLEESSNIRSRNKPFYEWDFETDLNQAMEERSIKKAQDVIQSLINWNAYFGFE